MDKFKLRYFIREAIEKVANVSSTFSVGDKVTTVDGDTATVTMAEHPFYTVELESTGTTKSFSFTELAPYEEKIIAKTSEGISLQEGVNASPGLLFHQQHKINLSECVYRIGSNSYVEFFAEARKLFNEGVLKVNEGDKILIRNTDIGEYGILEGKKVPLDIPFINEAEFKGKDVKLNKPKRGGSKAYYVYVKDGDKVKKVSFGSGGLRAKINNPEARRAFAARHNCENKKDRTTAGYWSCNLPRYAKALGLGANKNTFW
tara:strand:- start:496 stop:1275 length:780 start_codon:yes stop_codon:yes gene_type:complete